MILLPLFSRSTVKDQANMRNKHANLLRSLHEAPCFCNLAADISELMTRQCTIKLND